MTSLEKLAASAALAILASLACCSCNQFDPHQFPAHGPFFEGWYVRIIDREQIFSGGVLFGQVLPGKSRNSSDHPPLALVSIVHSVICPSCRLWSQTKFFNASDVKVSVDGHPVSGNPDDASPPNFEWAVPGGRFTCTGNETRFSFTLGNVSLEGVAGPPTPWGPGGRGPEWPFMHLPLPLHWFVYSLDSPVLTYTFQNRTLGVKVTGKNAHAHMEKNWGNSFPPGWIWVDAINVSSGVVLSFSGGLLDLYHTFDVHAYLVGYRNPAKKIVLNYTPASAYTVAKHDSCQGFVTLTVEGLLHRLTAEVYSCTQAFSDCLYGPEVDGFRKACVESYNAIVRLEVYSRMEKGLEFSLVDKQVIHGAALEFGGKFVCGDKCNKQSLN